MNFFLLAGLSHAPFAPLFEMNDDRLADIGIVRMRSDSDHGYPCRVSLQRLRRLSIWRLRVRSCI